ncbi:response regulator [Catenulispora yoronensis]
MVGEAAHSEEALARVVERRPDIVLLDVEIPGRRTTDTVARMRRDSPSSRIIMLSMYDPPIILRELISEGISGYLLKSVDRKELVAAIRSVHLAPERMVLSISRESLAQLHRTAGPQLSEPQLAVLRLVAGALSNRQIASRMQVSEATVKRHLHSVFTKLGAVSRIDAVNKATAAGLITGDPGDNAWTPDG